MRCRLPMLLAFAAAFALAVHAQAPADELSKSSLEELTRVKIKVTSASRKDEDLDETPAAVYVITREDIARSSAGSIPDLLRTVPGLQVAQINASTWAVSARGFNSAFANKLLVLIDGRTVYSEIYAGAHWDEIDLPLDTIDHIEVIRGPGAAVWGANAVNGVINILTLPARSVQGTQTSAGYARMQSTAFAQKGGVLGDRAQYRAFASFTDRHPLENHDGSEAFDGEKMARAGGRIDWQRGTRDHFIFTGDGYRANLKQQVIPGLALPIPAGGLEHDQIYGGFLSGNWRHDGLRNTPVLQSYVSTSTRHELSLTARTRTLDADFVDHQRANSRVDLVWGSEVRYTQDSLNGPVAVTASTSYNNYLANGFLQADFTLKPHKLIATVGSKVGHSTLAGFQLQPSARMIWLLDTKQSLWGAVSRAVVAPSIQDKELWVPVNLGTYNGLPVVGNIAGNPLFRPEEVISGELGYRFRPNRHVSFDLATFRNIDHRIQSLTFNVPVYTPTPSPHLEADFTYGNGYSGVSLGAELAANWRPTPDLQFSAAYTCIRGDSKQVQPGNISQVDVFSTPRNTVAVTGNWAFAHGWNAGGMLYDAGVVKYPAETQEELAFDANTGLESSRVPHYTRLDLHLKRAVRQRGLLEFSGTNLLQPRHPEFVVSNTFIVSHLTPRSLFARASWSF